MSEEKKKFVFEYTSGRCAVNEDSMWRAWQEAAPKIYEKIYYKSNPLVAYFNNGGHFLSERFFSEKDYFGRVCEVGAGTGYHLQYVRHGFDEYFITDINRDLLDKAKQKYMGRSDLVFRVEDATRLSFPDGSFDRLISIYNLEHLLEPYLVLKEWARVVRKGGVITIAIPTEGGVAWRLGRYLTTRRSFIKQGLNLDYIIAREHVNSCYNLVSLIRYYFRVRQEIWFPARIPLIDINLIYVCQVKLE